MLKFIFNFLTEPLGLPIAWYWEYMILAGIGAIAYLLSYGIVGIMYDNGEIYGREAGSFCHWVIRLICFVVLWAIAYGIIAFIKWICDNWIIVLSICGGLIALSSAVIITIKIVRKVKAGKAKNATDER